jgi:hypothetical protein
MLLLLLLVPLLQGTPKGKKVKLNGNHRDNPATNGAAHTPEQQEEEQAAAEAKAATRRSARSRA